MGSRIILDAAIIHPARKSLECIEDDSAGLVELLFLEEIISVVEAPSTFETEGDGGAS
jgi:hypothetical protein